MSKFTKEFIRQQCSATISPKFQDIMRKIGDIADHTHEKCYVVGGLPRDCILGKPNEDLDFVCTNPAKIVEELKHQYPSVVENPEKKPTTRFESKIVYFDKEKIDLVEPRKESYLRDVEKLKQTIGETARQADTIKPIITKGEFYDDAMRRDFTMNSLYLGVGKNDWLHIVDLTQRGLDDLEQRVLDTPQEPEITFTDDPTRMLRAVRFAACKSMTLSPRVSKSIQENANEINRVPVELIRSEILKGGKCPNYFHAMDTVGLMQPIFPDVTSLKGLHQNPKGHTTDAFNHTLRAVEYMPQDSILRIAMLLHDIGKATTTDAEGHAYDHDIVSGEKTRNILEHFRFTTIETERITRLVESHMKLSSLSNNQQNPKTIRRFIQKYGDILPDLIDMTKADILSDHPNQEVVMKDLQRTINAIRITEREMGEISKRDFKLAINGYDLMQEGYKDAKIGHMQSQLRELVIDGKIENTREALMSHIRQQKK